MNFYEWTVLYFNSKSLNFVLGYNWQKLSLVQVMVWWRTGHSDEYMHPVTMSWQIKIDFILYFINHKNYSAENKPDFYLVNIRTPDTSASRAYYWVPAVGNLDGMYRVITGPHYNVIIYGHDLDIRGGLFQQFVRTNKENIKAPHYCPFWGESSGHQWIILRMG